jgi:hypothetical protein
MKSDKQIQQDVMAELSWEPSVNAAHIGVEVSGGIVTCQQLRNVLWREVLRGAHPVSAT